MKLPRRFAPFAFSVMQAAVTTAVATLIAVWPMAGTQPDFAAHAPRSWALSWLTMLPVVILLAPMLNRVVAAFTDPGS